MKAEETGPEREFSEFGKGVRKSHRIGVFDIPEKEVSIISSHLL